jgi:6-phosphogluconolactonase (cycloisomerase 2 family)
MHRTNAMRAVSVHRAGSKNNFLPTLLSLALMFIAIATPKAHAAAAAKRYAYVADPGGRQILAYSVTPATGVLVPLPGACAATPAGVAPVNSKVDPTGRYLYVADQGGNTIIEFPINEATGCLGAPFPGFPTLGLGPFFIGITEKNSFLYISDFGNGLIDAFSINPVNGNLAPVPGSPFPAGPNPAGLVADAVGSCVFVANAGGAATISGFTINAGGTLAPAGPPTATGAGTNPFGLALDVVGQSLLVTNNVAAGTLMSYPVTPGGGCLLGPAFPPRPAGGLPYGVAASSFGQVAYVANGGPPTVASYLLNPVTAAPGLPNGPNLVTPAGSFGVTIDPTARYVYVVNQVGSVSGFTITPGNGLLVPIGGSPWAAGHNPLTMAITP